MLGPLCCLRFAVGLDCGEIETVSGRASNPACQKLPPVNTINAWMCFSNGVSATFTVTFAAGQVLRGQDVSNATILILDVVFRLDFISASSVPTPQWTSNVCFLSDIT